MTVTEGIILGLVQGITEFLPISSTGHLILVRELFGISHDYGLAVDAVLQLATALAVLVYFRAEFLHLLKQAVWMAKGFFIEQPPVAFGDRALILALVLGTIPAVILGLLLEDRMETIFRSAELVASMLIVGSLLMLGAEYVFKRRSPDALITPIKGFLIGCFQALALIPGMSRSGSTIAGGLIVGLPREDAARFAFMLSLPIILGSGLKKLFELGVEGQFELLGLSILAGALVSFVVGMLAIHYLLKYLRSHTLLLFVVYRVALAVVVFALL